MSKITIARVGCAIFTITAIVPAAAFGQSALQNASDASAASNLEAAPARSNTVDVKPIIKDGKKQVYSKANDKKPATNDSTGQVTVVFLALPVK